MDAIDNDRREQRSIQSIEVGFRLIRVLEQAGRKLPLKEISLRADMAAGKAHLYLVSFMRVGLVVQDAQTMQYGMLARRAEIVTQIQATGLAISEGHLFRGLSAIAAPVFDHTGALAGSVSMLGLGSQIDRSPDGPMAASLHETAQGLSTALGHMV